MRLYACLVPLVAAAASVLCAQAPTGHVTESNVMIPARDGVGLATDIYFPARDGERLPGPFPVILVRTPYGKSAGSGPFFAKRGYAYAVQDVRGRGASEGAFYIYVHEGEDGYDSVEWLGKQPWCNGAIGTYGGSYLAATQNALAALRPPHLAAMFVTVGTSNYMRDGAGRGGAFALLHNLVYCAALARGGVEARDDKTVAAALDDAYRRLPELLESAPLGNDSPLAHAPSYDKWYGDWRDHSTYDDYWKQNGYNFEERHAAYPDVAIYLVGGWFDIFKRGTLNNFVGLASREAPTRLVMGPWTHGVGGTTAGNVSFGGDAAFAVRAEALRWFDRHLKGIVGPIDAEPRVRYFTMGTEAGSRTEGGGLRSGGAWHTAPTWPPPEAHQLALYLHRDRTLRHEPPSAQAAPSGFVFDPETPVPSLGGNIDSGQHLVPAGPRDQNVPPTRFAGPGAAPLSERADILSFVTDPLEEPMEVTGPMHAELWVSSDAVDTDFTAKLIDVYPASEHLPDGYAMNLEDGILRARFRNSPEREELMEPGTVYPITVDLWATSNVFHKGHRIRLDISSSSFPMYDVNPNTGEPIGKHTKTVVARNAIHHDLEHRSRLVLSVIER